MRLRSAWRIAALALTAALPRVALAEDSVPELMRQLQRTKDDLAKLQPATAQNGEASSAFRFIKYGITAGVSAALYTPAGERNTLSSVAAGAMPFAGFFPAFWSGSGARNAYCAVEWSAPQSVAEKSAEAQDTGKTKSKTDAKDATAEAAKKVADADRALDTASTAEKLAAQAPSPAATDAVVKAKADADQKVKEAGATVAKAQEKAEKISKFDLISLKDERDHKEGQREDDEQRLEDRIDEWQAGAGKALSALPPEHLRQLARDYYKERQGLAAEFRACKLDEKNGIAPPGGCKYRILTLDPAQQPPVEPSCSDWVSKKSGMGTAVGLAACSVVLTRTAELDAKEQYKEARDAYRGSSTNCSSHKIGFFFGYPAMFNASTWVQSASAANLAKRDVDPVMSHGIVFAPNALVGLTAGSWIGLVDVTQDETQVVWGFTFGAAITADVFNLIR